MSKSAVRTFTGRLVDLLDTDPADIDLLDVAHALSFSNRFNGHTSRPSNVARHCLVVADMVATATDDARVVAAALMHDASEAYIGDMVHPLKVVMPEFREVEARLEATLDELFGIGVTVAEHRLIKDADITARLWEQRDITASTHRAPGQGRFVVPLEAYPTCDAVRDRREFLLSAHNAQLGHGPLAEAAIEALRRLDVIETVPASA